MARALLKKPKVLIFDEATSSLDEASAEHIAQTVNSLHGKVSMLFIAHRVPKNLRFDTQVQLLAGDQPAAAAVGAVTPLRATA